MDRAQPHRIEPADALRLAVAAIGSQAAFARLIGKTQSVVSKWLARGGHLPAEHVLAVEAATGISRHDLRPDLHPREDAATRLTRHRRAIEPTR